VDEILASVLTMIHRNPFQEGQDRINFVDEYLVKTNTPINDYSRCMHLINPDGIVYESLNAVKLGLDSNIRDKMHFIDYNDMVSNPDQVMEDIYDFLGEEYYEHKFDGLSNIHRENDINTYGLNDMHEVHSKLEKTSSSPESILPEEILNLYNENKESLEFWSSK